MGSLPHGTLCVYCGIREAGYIPDGCPGPICLVCDEDELDLEAKNSGVSLEAESFTPSFMEAVVGENVRISIMQYVGSFALRASCFHLSHLPANAFLRLQAEFCRTGLRRRDQTLNAVRTATQMALENLRVRLLTDPCDMICEQIHWEQMEIIEETFDLLLQVMA
tara:strand:+ start:145 stop:639 length:495 start_codon:yes stop_codon:yes gene_type:complete